LPFYVAGGAGTLAQLDQLQAIFDVFVLFFIVIVSRVFSSSPSEKTVEWRPSVFPLPPSFWQSAVSMFLRSNNRKKEGITSLLQHRRKPSHRF
jgi:hypothetical protein